MRNFRKLVLTAFLVAGSLIGWATNPKPFVVPELTQWQGGEGEMQPSGQLVHSRRQKEHQRSAWQIPQRAACLLSTGTSRSVLWCKWHQD